MRTIHLGLSLLIAASTWLTPHDTFSQVSGHAMRRGAIKLKKNKRSRQASKKEIPSTPEDEKSPAYLGRVSRGDIEVTIKTRGTVRAEEIFRLKSTIEGRVESVFAKPMMWFPANKQLADILNKELAAIVDAKATTPQAVMTDRWQGVYKPAPIACLTDCFVLKTFARNKRWVEPGALLIEAARKLRLIGRIPPGFGRFINEGQIITFWDVKNPKKKIQARIENFILDVQGQRVQSAGTFTVLLNQKHYLNPGTQWEGVIHSKARKNVLRVPTDALIIVDDQAYLPVRVSTGVTTNKYTEIESGVTLRETFLFIDKATDVELQRHEPPPILLQAAPQRRARTRRVRRVVERPRRNGEQRQTPAVEFIIEQEEEEEIPEAFDEQVNELFPSDIQP